MTAKQYVEQAKKLVADGDYDTINDAMCEVARQHLTQHDCEKWHNGDGSSRNVNVILHAFEMINKAPTWIQIWGSPNGLEPVSVNLF